MNKIIELNVYPEICCELCNNTIHTHINCVICKGTYAPTTHYGELEDTNILKCKNCKTKYKLLPNENWYNFPLVEIITK